MTYPFNVGGGITTMEQLSFERGHKHVSNNSRKWIPHREASIGNA